MTLEIRKIPIEQANPAAYNPRLDLQPGDPEWEKLRNSILEFGYIDPIIWNEQTGNIVGGHQRYKILQFEGYTEIDVSVVNFDPAKERAANLALNKIGGDFVADKVAELLAYLQENEYDLSLTGYDGDEIEELLNDYFDEQEPEDRDPEDFDPDLEAEAIIQPYSKPGDIWELGPHRVACGDSLNPDIWEELTEGARADMIFTDPPYNVDYSEKNSYLNRADSGNRNQDPILNDKMSKDDFFKFLYTVFSNLFEHTEPGGALYCCYSDFESVNFKTAIEAAGFKISQNLIWVKNNHVLGMKDYQVKHEPIFYGWKEGGGHNWYGDRDKKSVYDEDINPKELDKKQLIALVKELMNRLNTSVVRIDKPQRSQEHPTMKPLALVRHFLKNSSRRGELVLDGFLGSGSTLIAADQLGRICYGVEYDPRYVQVIIERYLRHTQDRGDVFCHRNGEKVPYREILEGEGRT